MHDNLALTAESQALEFHRAVPRAPPAPDTYIPGENGQTRFLKSTCIETFHDHCPLSYGFMSDSTITRLCVGRHNQRRPIVIPSFHLLAIMKPGIMLFEFTR